MEDFKNRRRNYYIDKQFQGLFVMKFCALVAASSAISGTIIYFMSKNTVCTTFEHSKLTIKSTADFILPAVLLSSIVSIILIGLATIMVTLFTSHKIAGPLYRLAKDVQEIAAGNLKIVFRLRTGDELKPFLASMNDMIIAIRDRIAGIKQDLDSVEASVNLPAEAKNGMRRMRESLEKFKT